jgi:hypothetical protein
MLGLANVARLRVLPVPVRAGGGFDATWVRTRRLPLVPDYVKSII